MSKKVFIAGGGTGGHFYPALATSKYLAEKGYEIFYFGTKYGIEKDKDFVGKKFLYDIKGIRGKTGKIKSSFKLLKTAFEIKKIIKKEKPDFAICFGGYTSVPLGIASKLTNTPLFIHEQNSIPSYTNLLLSKIAKKIFITFDYSFKYFPKNKTVKTGLPIRKSVKDRLNLKKEEARKILSLDNRKIVLIFGGSQGAKRLNELAVNIAKNYSNLLVINIFGKSDYNEELPNLIKFPYYEDMGLLYKVSDIVISRSGSGTVNELIAFGKYSIYIPYPYAASDHQFYNVKWLEEKGLSKVLRENQLNKFFEIFDNILKLDITNFEDKIKQFSILNAEERIYKEIEKVL
ncbi:undecaprenyldiphospho-muramoylpentapeptide beta-N-acetylglucosaminyltransferase [Hydrogenothermus marinus]|uniref:UDP-N-acetylglucosamine--N-acetylmuramyl-(pentapeptide) pyrophosphoryl-undecaprenol N-acetylglucosamine transferase n=1 Tax=Hydrogenothermus marinus TaxID=133270 RepID=A0A3M0BE57_9AQUI|nr:undecaprenyldiphospho-muramoylpentapeptide beta-N-acetylglucosaminyltransferase [Hydrogenothermus marinus]RMA93258.1 UDP-N-acetylglucosamine-N-acetylmuramylpentapeptide N-acetylglucosamine transferase [Hydrogenothermus marinus]